MKVLLLSLLVVLFASLFGIVLTHHIMYPRIIAIPREVVREVVVDRPKTQFYDSSNSVIIVGNAPNVLDKKLGHLIDQYDVVVRLNNFSIQGFEEHVGTKTTVWFHSDNRTLMSGGPYKQEHVFVPPNSSDPYSLSITQTIYKGSSINDTHSVYRYSERIGYDMDTINKHYITTGAAAVLYYSDLYKNVTIYGFSLGDDLVEITHYFEDHEEIEDKTGISTVHKKPMEDNYILDMIHNSTIQRL